MMLHRFYTASLAILTLGFVCLVASNSRLSAQKSTAKDRELIAEIEQAIKDAGRAFKNEKYDQSAESIVAAAEKLLDVAQGASNRTLLRLKPSHSRISKATEMLAAKNVETIDFPTWANLLKTRKKESPSPNETGKSNQQSVSFAKSIAPILTSKCGSCHINQARGDFSVSTIAALKSGVNGATVIFPKDVIASRLVEVIETGDMPRGPNRVSAAELALLKNWIASGAPFDADDSAQLRALAANSDSGAVPANVPNADNKIVLGKGAVSFGQQIAPILLKNCNGCHVGGNNRRGGLRMNSMMQLARGGDSGPPILPSKSDMSLLVKRILGQGGDRMPGGGRPALSAEEIKLIRTWIDEGAKYDGSNPSQPLQSVIDETFLSSASDEELIQRASVDSKNRWARVLPNDEPKLVNVDQFMVIGNVSTDRLQAIAEQLTESKAFVLNKMQLNEEQLRLPPLLPVFVFSGRYDYGEFGRMTESRSLPLEWSGHHRTQGLDQYLVLVDQPSDEKAFNDRLVQLYASAVAGSFGAPNWFSTGVGRSIMSLHNKRSEVVKRWQSEVPLAIQKIRQPADLMELKIGEEESALAGYAMVEQLSRGKNRRNFLRLWQRVAEGMDFQQAVSQTYAPMEDVIRAWLGLR